MAYNKMKLTLLIDPEENRVVYAEASKEAIDCIFNMLQLPMGTVVSLLSPEAMPGSVGPLYASVEDIGEGYWLSNQNRGVLLQPPMYRPADAFPLATNNVAGSWMPALYTCPLYCKQFKVTDMYGYECKQCKPLRPAEAYMNKEVEFVTGGSASGGDGATGPGFVRPGLIYLIDDDLFVEPASGIKGLVKQKRLHRDSLQVREVELTKETGIKILKASLHTNMVLTTVFLSET